MELFQDIINKSLEIDDMSVFNMMVVSLISSYNNVTEEEIEKNCNSIEILIEVLSKYSYNNKLQKNRQQLIAYYDMYSK